MRVADIGLDFEKSEEFTTVINIARAQEGAMLI